VQVPINCRSVPQYGLRSDWRLGVFGSACAACLNAAIVTEKAWR